MSLRTLTSFVLCLAMLAGGTLGTASGMVLCVDGHGHMAVEAPHDGLAHRHGGCSDDHAPHDAPSPEPGSASLHGAQDACSDAGVAVQVVAPGAPNTAGQSVRTLAVVPFAIACDAVSVPSLSLPLDGRIACSRGGATRVGLESIRAVVLLV